MKKILVLVAFLSGINCLMAQSDYSPICSEGTIPTEFIQLTAEKIKLANEKIDHNTELSKKQINQFNSYTNYYIDYLMKSGKIIFGTSMNQYVNKVGALVLEQFPEIKDQVRFYLVKSPEVNAFTNNTGYVFINIGLIAQLENEAQLAYIMSHELIHYKYKHSIISYTEDQKAQKGVGNYERLSLKRKQSTLIQYSHKHEFTADSLGFLESYAKIGYDYNEALTVFDVLLYSDLPYDELEFDTTYFNDQYYSLKSNLILPKVEAISNPEDFDDSKSSHPNIRKRRSKIIDIVLSYEDPSNKKYLISEADFSQMQQQARFELSNLYLSNLEYGKAFYNSYLLSKKYPDNKYVQTTMAYTLHVLAIYLSNSLRNEVIKHYNDVSGQSQRVFYFLRKIDKMTASTLAVKYLYILHERYPEDAFIKNVLDEATINLVKANFTLSQIYNPIGIDSNGQFVTTRNGVKETFKVLSKEDYEALSKYDKIRYDKKHQQFIGKTSEYANVSKDQVLINSYYGVLTSLKAKPEFVDYFLKMQNEYGKVEEEAESSSKKKKGKVKAQTYPSGSVILSNPDYYRFEKGKLVIDDFEQSEKLITSSFRSISNQVGLKVEYSDILQLSNEEVFNFNQQSLLNDWFEEYYMHRGEENNTQITPWLSNYTESIQGYYHTKYLAKIITFEVSNPKNQMRIRRNFFGMLVFWQASPYFLSQLISKDNSLHQVLFLVDITSGKTLLYDYESSKGLLSNDHINSVQYYHILQMKNTLSLDK
jgi:hypothetical protein